MKPFTRISDIYEKKSPLPNHVPNSARHREERLSNLKERYSTFNLTQSRQELKQVFSKTNFQSPLTSRRRGAALNNDIANVDESLNISMATSGHKRELSTQKKIKIV